MRNVSGILEYEIRKQILNLNEKVFGGSISCNNGSYYRFIGGYDNPPKEYIMEEDKIRFNFMPKTGMHLYGNKLCLNFDFNWNSKDIHNFIVKAILNDSILDAIKNNELFLDIDCINLKKSFKGSEFGTKTYRDYNEQLEQLKSNIDYELCLLGINQSNYDMENIC